MENKTAADYRQPQDRAISEASVAAIARERAAPFRDDPEDPTGELDRERMAKDEFTGIPKGRV